MPSLNVALLREVARANFNAAALPAGTVRTPYLNYLDAMASALQQAVDLWRMSAEISDVKIMGPTVFAGKLTGPGLDGVIRGFAPAGTWDPYSRAIAAGVHNQCRAMCAAPTITIISKTPAISNGTT